jgi:cell cycle checkpoint control protein RAD9A
MLPPPVPSKAWNDPPSPVKDPESDLDSEPLFLPCSQLSQAEIDVLKSTGLGIEEMNADEFADMLDGEGEEVDFGFVPPSQEVEQMELEENDFDLVDEFGATQSSDNQKARIVPRYCRLGLTFLINCIVPQAFQPLFED